MIRRAGQCFTALGFALSIQCADIPSENQLPLSPYDIKPTFGAQPADSVDSAVTGDSVAVVIDNLSLDHMEFSTRIRLSDYEPPVAFSAFDTTRTIRYRGLCDNIGAQRWMVEIIGRYAGNTRVSDTIRRSFSIDDDRGVMFVSPSAVHVSQASAFYIDVALDEIADSVLAGQCSIRYQSDLLRLDSIESNAGDSLGYFHTTGGDLVAFFDTDSLNGEIHATFAYHSGMVEGASGSGRLLRMHFSPLAAGGCAVALTYGELRDQKNRTLLPDIDSAAVTIFSRERNP